MKNQECKKRCLQEVPTRRLKKMMCSFLSVFGNRAAIEVKKKLDLYGRTPPFRRLTCFLFRVMCCLLIISVELVDLL